MSATRGPAGLLDRLRDFRAVLLDLDGTLLGNDIDAFVPQYLRAVARVAAGHVEPESFVRELLRATQAMVDSTDPAKTNAEVFAEHFYPAVGLTREVWGPAFERFYRETFPRLRSLTYVKPAARRVLDAAVARGCELVLATNPVFPRLALEERLRWANAADYPWRLITDYETMHHTKPHLGYYQEILELVGRDPAECLMVGNDVEEDMVAGQLGIATFLETTQLIQRKPGPRRADAAGTLDDLYHLLR